MLRAGLALQSRSLVAYLQRQRFWGYPSSLKLQGYCHFVVTLLSRWHASLAHLSRFQGGYLATSLILGRSPRAIARFSQHHMHGTGGPF
jgi:hypothetical protein